MQVLIVQASYDLAQTWGRFLERRGLDCTIANDESAARAALRARPFDAVVLDMELPEGAALAVADYAAYRNPEVPIIAVTAQGFFSDGAVFELVPNARGVLNAPLKPADMAALVEHYGGRHEARLRAAGEN